MKEELGNQWVGKRSPTLFADKLGKPGDSIGKLGKPGDSIGKLGKPGDSIGKLGKPGDVLIDDKNTSVVEMSL